MVGARGQGICMLDLVSVGGMSAREECSSSRGTREEKFKKSCRALAMQFGFSCSCSWRVRIGFFGDTFFESLKGGGEGDVGEVGGLELGLADGSGTDQTVQKNVRLHLQHGTHQQG